MPRATLIAIGASALAATAAGAATAAAGGQGHARGQGAAAKTITLKLRSKLDRVQTIDNAPTGPSAGDQFVFTEKLFDAKGKSAGSDAATCTSLFDQRSLCTGVYLLHGGQIMVQLVQPGPTGTYSQAITGGTGKYAGVTGTVTLDQRQSGDRFTFHIRRPGR